MATKKSGNSSRSERFCPKGDNEIRVTPPKKQKPKKK